MGTLPGFPNSCSLVPPGALSDHTLFPHLLSGITSPGTVAETCRPHSQQGCTVHRPNLR